jgi:hypothetical protein
MKKILCALLFAISLPALAQETADNKRFHNVWTFIYDQNGQPTTKDNAVAGKYYLITSFNFTGETKYEFTLDEFAADGTLLTQVREYGNYTLGKTQFNLQPQKSETVFDPPSKQKRSSAAATKIMNPLQAATYTWQIEGEKMITLLIQSARPGYREGVFSSAGRSYNRLPPDKRRSTARSM